MSQNDDVKLPFKQIHAFIIGLDAYEQVSPLRTAAADAKGMFECIKDFHDYQIPSPNLYGTKAELITLFT